MEYGVVRSADPSAGIRLAGPVLIHVCQLAGRCDQITVEGHSRILRAQDPLVIVDDVAEMGIATFANRP
jgi:hypothetical protein